jgi:hypothetical protein
MSLISMFGLEFTAGYRRYIAFGSTLAQNSALMTVTKKQQRADAYA